MATLSFRLASIVILATCLILARGQLSPGFYDKVCPQALPTIKKLVEEVIAQEPRMGASLLRLHFHDCFVLGCDGSVLLDDTPTFTGEKNAAPNMNSLRGFEVVDRIKAVVNEVCKGNVVSCADVVAVAARDSIVAVLRRAFISSATWKEGLKNSKQGGANKSIPAPTLDFSGLLSNFQSHGLSLKDLVVLSGGHTLGFARCTNFRSRLYNETKTLESNLANSLKAICPISGSNNNEAPFDGSPTRFNTVYYDWLIQKKGLLHSDQQLFKGDESGADGLVKFYSSYPSAFWKDFGESILRMGSMKPLTVNNGEIRMNCRRVN